MRFLLFSLLLLPSRPWAAGRAGEKAGDVQVGPDVDAGALPGIGKERESSAQSASPPPRPALKRSDAQGSSVPGIYPVYEYADRWLLIERKRRRRSRGAISPGSEFVVIGSRGAEVFYAAASTRTWAAACQGSRHVPASGYYLSAKSRKAFGKVGVPIMAIALKKGKAFDVSRAYFYRLKNEVKESTYQKLEQPLRQAVVADLLAGAYPMRPEDEEGRRLARSPDPDRIQVKLEFGSKIRALGFKDAFLLVEGSQVSQAYRRCLRLFSGDKPVGSCAQMPNALMLETSLLHFVAYDPSRRGQPFILAFSDKPEPLWGHERWGFRLTEDGPSLFLQDALDPRCREGF